MHPAFVPAGPRDIDLLLDLMRQYYAFDRIPFHPHWARQSLERLLADGGLGRMWLIQRQGETVGYACVCFGFSLEYGRDAFLDELFVREPFRGQGIGRAAVEFVAAACPELGIQVLHLVVTPGNERARRLYEKLGFEDEHRRMMTRWIVRPEAPSAGD